MKTILLIEDNELMRENTMEILELSHYHVLPAKNGRIGLAAALENHPDLIICDVMMPEMNGWDVLKEFRHSALANQIPFIFLTARVEKSDIQEGFNLGASEYLAKPFNGEELLRVVSKYLSA